MTKTKAWEKALVEGLDRFAGQEARERVLSGMGDLPSSSEAADWVREVMARMDQGLDPATRAAVLELCGQTCLGTARIARARGVGQQFTDLVALLAFLNERHIGGGKLRLDRDVVYAVYDRCYCPRISQSTERISPTYCHCSRGWLGALFGALLGRAVEVELVSSVLAGNPVCELAIRPSAG